MAQCTGIMRGGGRCKGIAIEGSGLCYLHNPEYAEARRRSARRGGKTGGRGRPKQHVALVHKTADTMIGKLLRGEIEPSVAAVVIQAGHLKLRAVLADLKVEEHEEVLKRVEELEALLAERQRQGGQRGA